MTNAQLEHVVMVQARELEAQRRTIERQSREIRKLHEKVRADDKRYRQGYQAEHLAASRRVAA